MLHRTGIAVIAALLCLMSAPGNPAMAHSMGLGKSKDLTPPLKRYFQEVEDLRKDMGAAADTVRSVFDRFDLWDPAIPVTICFLDGSDELRAFFEATSQDWVAGTGLRLDLGSPPIYAACDPTNPADIRVSFKQPGNWSFIGTISLASDLVAKPSLNVELGDIPFANLDKAVLGGTILHELGHALGLEHEHQSPQSHCDDEFDWDKVYAYFKDNVDWDKDKVDLNMRSLVDQDRLLMTPYDPHSIMHYYFDAWMFKQGEASRCFAGHNESLSDVDRTAIREVYPRDDTPMTSLLQNQADAASPTLSALHLDRKQLMTFGRTLMERLSLRGRKPTQLRFDLTIGSGTASSGTRSLDQTPMVPCDWEGANPVKGSCEIAEDASALTISAGQ